MKRRGFVQYTLEGLNLEKIINEGKKNGVSLKAIKREKNRKMTIVSSLHDYETLSSLAASKGCRVSAPNPKGLLRLEKTARRRLGLLVGAAVGIALIAWALQFVWKVEIHNAGAYLGEVRSYLTELGIKPGILRRNVSLSELRSSLEWRFPQVKWVRTQWRGTHLCVSLEEGTPPPNVENGNAYGNVVASEDGLLLYIAAFSGTPIARAGDFVRSGDILIKGEERGKDGMMVPVKARGEAKARVWISARARVRAMETETVSTGREAIKKTLRCPFCAYVRGSQPDWEVCDVEKALFPVVGAFFPVWMEKETYVEGKTRLLPRDAEEAKKEGERCANFLLDQALIDDEIVDKWINFSMIEGDTILVTATAEVIRSIGRSEKQ